MITPTDLHYSKTDEWVRLEGSTATIGVTDYAQEQLSDVVFVEVLATVGSQVKKDANIASIESVKAAADVSSPVAGKVLAANDALAGTPEWINSHPYDQAWLLKLQIDNQDEFDLLMDASAYEVYCKERSH